MLQPIAAMRDVVLRLSVLITVAASCSAGSGARVPVQHRVTSAGCPQQRGSGVSIDPSGCAQNPVADLPCTKDGDCTAGANGRCLQELGPACRYACSYDACSSDSDCAAGTLPQVSFVDPEFGVLGEVGGPLQTVPGFKQLGSLVSATGGDEENPQDLTYGTNIQVE